MEITKKCKEDFEKWFNKNSHDEEYNHWALVGFYKFHPSMQWGVYVDFFESNGLIIEICYMHLSKYYYWMINDGSEENKYKTRPEARTGAIEKANEIYNTK